MNGVKTLKEALQKYKNNYIFNNNLKQVAVPV